MQVGLIVGNIGFVRDLFEKFNKTFGFIIDFGMMSYMFALGIEMDPYVFLQKQTRHVKVAYSGIITTFILAIILSPFVRYFPSLHKLLEFTSALAILLASTDSPVLTRLLTQLKIGKSDIGKLVIAAAMHSDFVCYCILSICYILTPLPDICMDLTQDFDHKKRTKMAFAVFGEVVFTLMVSPFFMHWVDNENPDGRPMKGPHLILSIAFVVLMIASSVLTGFSPLLSAFMVGVCFPREGRVSKWVITKINYLLNTIFFPIFFLWVGFEADFRQFEANNVNTWIKILLLLIVSIVGKVVGALFTGKMLGIHWPESVAIGLLLTTKGHLHIYLAIKVVNPYAYLFFLFDILMHFLVVLNCGPQLQLRLQYCGL